MKTQDLFTSTVLGSPGSETENCLAIGTRMSDFEITGILGEGGFGIVYIAFDHALQRAVAIKEYMPGALAGRASDKSVAVRSDRHQATFDVGLKSFINEARFLAQFDHPSLVKVYRYWEENQTAYMAMRYYHGRTIKDIVAQNPELVTPRWCMSITRQILEALETLYTKKILHRDVSPDNIIVQANGDAVLLDFGSARQIIGDMTKGLTIILKPGYAPVEQYADDASMQQGAWTDIYSLSAVMYFAITKEAPPTSIARMVKDTLRPLLSGEFDQFGAQFLAAIDQGLAVQAADRPQSIAAFRKLLGINEGPRARSSGSSSRNGANGSSGKRAGEQVKALASSAAAAAHKAQLRFTSKTDHADGAATSQSKLPWIEYSLVAASFLILIGLGIHTYLGWHSNTASVQPAMPLPAPALARAPAPDPETVAWDSLKDNQTAAQIAAFIEKFPAGRYADVARRRLSEFQTIATTPEPTQPQPAEVAIAPPIESPLPEKIAIPTPAATTSYKLAIKPWGTIYVDGQEKGVSPPLKKLSLPAGKHKIRIVNPSFPAYLSEIEVTNKKFGNIEHDFSVDPH
ncbi:serine/threonine protein kinase [Oxalobacteraceae bacterium GrIS 1.11]